MGREMNRSATPLRQTGQATIPDMAAKFAEKIAAAATMAGAQASGVGAALVGRTERLND